jgi:hypothetical protein
VKVSKFSYEYQLIENDTGNYTIAEAKEKWYIATRKIIDDFFSLLKSARL